MSAGSMDASRNFQETFIKPSSSTANPLRASADGFSAQSGGLMRYHSAPSSTFAALLESDFYSANDAAELVVQFLAQNGVSDIANFGNGGPPLKPHQKQPLSIKGGQSQQVYSSRNDVLFQHSGRRTVGFEDHLGPCPLSAILEHGGEETCVAQPCQGDSIASPSNGSISDSDDQYKSNLIRHSSLPTDFLSRLAMAGMSERPMASQQVGSHMQSSSQQVTSHTQSASPRIADNTGGKTYAITSRMSPTGKPVRKCVVTGEGALLKEEEYGPLESELNHQCGLSRQSSSPAGLLSQLSLDEFVSPADNVVTPIQSLVLGGWDEASMDFAIQKSETLGQRKRGRETDARSMKSLPASDPVMDQITTSPRNLYSVVGASNGDMTDAVIKSRAKRGCATHPRSIAERVRRTKISERIKKLQDLVPNLDKQAHTADMLDEVVEYVKLLQRQVEELSNQSRVCNGTCQKEGNNSGET